MSEPSSPRLQQIFKLLEREPNDTLLLYGVGMEYKKLAAPTKAIEYFERVISVDPGYCYAYFQKAQVLESMGQNHHARQSYQDGIAAAKRIGDNHAQSELESALSMIE
jgi:Tfp pilus assembly protein PilF